MISGFSKLNRTGRIKALEDFLGQDTASELDLFIHNDPDLQKLFSEFSENYLSNFFLPFGVVPNVLVNGKLYMVPMVVEESSVVAAASKSAGFWAKHGGFKAEIVGTTKKGQVHFTWDGNPLILHELFPELKQHLIRNTDHITERMKGRGGGITEISLLDKTNELANYFQLDISFETDDAMGANFINSCLEQMAESLHLFMMDYSSNGHLETIMSILSNYTPECLVQCEVQCNLADLAFWSGKYKPEEFAQRFQLAVQMANVDVSRAVTHNKGIYNGIDGVVLATGNDWRAIESGGHAFASKDGQYKSLSTVGVEGDRFKYILTIPLALGTIGGLTQIHPLSKLALQILRNPTAEELMTIVASLGLASNFSAVASLVTSGIQAGHMKLHLSNILNQLGATEEQKIKAKNYFVDKTVSHQAVLKFLNDNAKSSF